MQTKLEYLGHSTIVLDINGVRVATDPVFRRLIFHLVRTVPVPGREALRNIDVVLISHTHYDHLDISGIKSIGEHALVCVPRGAGKLLRKNKITNFRELSVGEEFFVGDLPIRTTYASHRSGRPPFDFETGCMGYLIGREVTIYFPGDTRLFPEMTAIADRIDIGLIPVWGWGPHLGEPHMSPQDAARALTLLHPKLAIPIHWGTYLPLGTAWLKPKFHRLPPRIFADAASKIAPDVEVRILRPGESTVYSS